MGRSLYAAGLRAGDLVHNAFSYHFTPAGSMMESGAHAIGCTVFPAGTGQTEQQVQAIATLAPAAYVGTPSFLRILLEKADGMGLALPSLLKAAVSGEAFRRRCVTGCRPGLAPTELPHRRPSVSSPTRPRLGMAWWSEGGRRRDRRPDGRTGRDGEVGEVVVTTAEADYPMIRSAPCTSRRAAGPARPAAPTPGSAAGSGAPTRPRRSRPVRPPAQVAEIVRRHAEVGKARLVVEGEVAADRMTLRVEVAGAAEGLSERIAQTVRDVTKLRAEVVLCAPGSLANDGKVIEDLRPVG